VRYTLATRDGSKIIKSVAQYTEAIFTAPHAMEVSVMMETKNLRGRLGGMVSVEPLG